MKSIIKKTAIVLGLMVVSGGLAFAAFSLTVQGSTGNTVTSASPGLQVTSTPISTTGLSAGGSTTPNVLTIKNTGNVGGQVSLNLTSKFGTLCTDLSLAIAGDATGTMSPIANGSVVLGTLNPGATMNLTQVVSMSSTSTATNQTCQWSETATISGS